MAIRVISGALGNVLDNPPSVAQVGRAIFGSDKRNPTGDPQRSYQWDVEFSVDGSNDRTAQNAKFYAKTVSIPQKSIETFQIDYQGVKIMHPGKDSSPKTVTITFWDDDNLTITKYIREWFSLLSHNELGDAVSSRRNFARDIKITLYEGNDLRTTGVIKMKQAFPTDISDVSLSYDNSGTLEVSVTFTYVKQSISSSGF